MKLTSKQKIVDVTTGGDGAVYVTTVDAAAPGDLSCGSGYVIWRCNTQNVPSVGDTIEVSIEAS